MIKCPPLFKTELTLKNYQRIEFILKYFSVDKLWKFYHRIPFSVFLIVSLAYITSYTLTNGFIVPLQSMLLPSYTTTISLLFLPHGIRVLAAYYYGWKAFFYLIPSTYLMWFVIVYGSGVPLHPLQPILQPFMLHNRGENDFKK